MNAIEALLLTYAEAEAKAIGLLELPKLIAKLQDALSKIDVALHPLHAFELKGTITILQAVLDAIQPTA
jgi:hypothetical protein